MQVKILAIFASLKTVVVAQLVRASDCDSEGRGFEPPRLPIITPHLLRGFFMEKIVVAQLVRVPHMRDDSEGRGFEPPRLPITSPAFVAGFFVEDRYADDADAADKGG